MFSLFILLSSAICFITNTIIVMHFHVLIFFFDEQVQTNPDCIKQYFGAEIGLFWQTIRTEEQSFYTDEEQSQVCINCVLVA